MECKKLNSVEEIKNVLIEFQEVFPHLMEKISSIDEYASKLCTNAEVYIGKKEKDTFGVLIFYANDVKTKTAYISLIGTKAEYRRQRLGEWLLNQCISISKKRGMKYLKLEVDSDNTNAKQFYERNGFAYLEDTGRNSAYMEKFISD